MGERRQIMEMQEGDSCYIQMEYSNMDHNQSDLEQWADIHLDSDLFLSKIQFEDMHNQSPQINVNTAQNKNKELAQTAQSILKKSKPYCGCGQYYSCTSSLYLHIRSKHGGIPPKNTIGGPKGIVKKPNPNVQDPLLKFQQNQGSRYNFVQNQNKPTFVMEGQQNQNKSYDQSALQVDPHSIDSRQKSRPDGNTTKVCKICSKVYSCNSSLNLHLKRKHEQRRREDGRIQYQARPEDKQPKNYECSICGLNYGSKSALGLHYNNKHNARNGNNQIPYENDMIQKCGCGLIYQSRSALNMHVKKKHNGEYPEGTTEKPNLRSKGRVSQNYIIEAQENQRQDIYDSQSEVKNSNMKRTEKNMMIAEKVYKCGCGRNYSCSSSLNLHIKKNHNWVIPKGTIGGPRGMKNDDDREKMNQQKIQPQIIQKVARFCQDCRAEGLKDTYFECQSCENHSICQNCFWKTNHMNDENHRWELVTKDK